MRSSIRKLPCLAVALIAAAAVGLSVVPVASAGGFKRCGKVRATVVAKGVSCRTARWVVRYALSHPSGNALRAPSGWGCGRGPSPDAGTYALRCNRVNQYSAEVRMLNR